MENPTKAPGHIDRESTVLLSGLCETRRILSQETHRLKREAVGNDKRKEAAMKPQPCIFAPTQEIG